MRNFDSLRTKFTRTMLLVTGFIGLATLAIVVFTSTRASQQQLTLVERYIEEGITSKGKVLTENQALALRGLTLDNAFLDMQALVDRAVKEDSDLYYGLYVNSQGQTLAYTRRGAAAEGERAVDEDAYRELGLSKDDLIVRKSRVQRTTRLGKELLEVAVPVVAEDGEIIGTIRYGLSTARMRDALARAKEDASTRLEHSLWIVGSLVSIAVLLGILLTRMQGTKITRPVTDLTLAAQGLAAGNRAVRVKIESRDELELLGASFNRMVEDLDASYRSLEEMNRTLEQKVELRTAELAAKNRDMRLVLDNVDQGFATLSPEGVMALERSRVVGQWFGECAEPLPFWTYLESVEPDFAMQFQLGWEQLAADILPLEASISQLPGQLVTGDRTFSFRYLPFHRDEKLEGVLVVIADVTERLAKAREEAEHVELMQLFKRLMLDRAGVDTFLREGNSLIDGVCAHRHDADRTLLKRGLHTLKGNAASMGLVVIAELCHELESQLAEHDRMSDAKLGELSARWSSLCQHVAELTGSSVEKVIEVPAAEYAALVSRLSTDPQVPSAVLHHLLEWRLEPVARPLQRLAEQARGLARRLGKGEIEVAIETNGVRLDPDRFNPVFSDLIHLVRNAVDHGLETPEERALSNKSPAGKLTFVARTSGDGGVVFEIGDDGRGVDWRAIRRDAQQRGLPVETPNDLLRALCHDGVTTSSTVTTVSGRGVGMAAVKQRVDGMNGRMEVRSTEGRGTTWIVSIPLSSAEISTLKPRTGPVVRVAARGA